MAVEGIEVSPAKGRGEIISVYLKYLQSVEPLGSEIAGTLKNAIYFTDNLFLPNLDRGAPILMARQTDGFVVGGTFTTLPEPGIDYVHPCASGHGTWVIPHLRGFGIARLLIDEVRNVLQRLGVKMTLGIIHGGNEPSRETFKKLGFTKHGTVVRADL